MYKELSPNISIYINIKSDPIYQFHMCAFDKVIQGFLVMNGNIILSLTMLICLVFLCFFY